MTTNSHLMKANQKLDVTSRIFKDSSLVASIQDSGCLESTSTLYPGSS